MPPDKRKVHFKGPGAWLSQAEDAQAETAPPAAALEPHTIQRGLDWAAEEYELLRAFNPREPRDAHGHWVHGAGHVQTLAGLGQGKRAPAGGEGMRGPDPTVAQLATMVRDLQQQVASQQRRLHVEDTRRGDQLHDVVDNIRTEHAKLIAGERADVKVSGISDERRKIIVETLANVLGLLAVAGLILATAGMALPPLAAAGVAVGPLIGGEAVKLLHERHLQKQAARGK